MPRPPKRSHFGAFGARIAWRGGPRGGRGAVRAGCSGPRASGDLRAPLCLPRLGCGQPGEWTARELCQAGAAQKWSNRSKSTRSMCVLLGLSVTIRGDGLLPGGRGPTRGAAAGERTGAREHRHAAALRQGEAEGEVRRLGPLLKCLGIFLSSLEASPPAPTAAWCHTKGLFEGFIMALGLGKCTAERLMPNIAIYCKTPMRSKGEELPAPWRPLALVAGTKRCM